MLLRTPESSIERVHTWAPCSAPLLWVCRTQLPSCQPPARGPPPCQLPCWGRAGQRPQTAKPASNEPTLVRKRSSEVRACEQYCAAAPADVMAGQGQ